MSIVERIYIGPQINSSVIRYEHSSGGVPTVAVAKFGNLAFTNGVVSNDPATGEVISGDIRVQTRQVLENLKLGLHRAGLSVRTSRRLDASPARRLAAGRASRRRRGCAPGRGRDVAGLHPRLPVRRRGRGRGASRALPAGSALARGSAPR